MSSKCWRVLGLAAVAALALSLAVGAQAGDGYRIIVNESNPVAAMSPKEISDLFLGNTTKWPHNAPVKAVDLSATSPVRAAFTRDVHGKKVEAVLNYWQQVIFSGRGVPPPSKATDADVLNYVIANPGAIGYVSMDAPTGDVKVLSVKK